MFEARFHNYAWHSNREDNMLLTKQSEKLLKEITELVVKFKSHTDGKRWFFWIPVVRGSFEEYAEWNELFDDNSTDKEIKEYKERWEKESQDIYWHKITLILINGYTLLYIDGNSIISTNFEEEGCFPHNYDDLLSYILKEIRKIYKKAEQGKYNAYINKVLPYENRRGEILREEFWKISPENYEYDMNGLTEEEIHTFLKYAEKEVSQPIGKSNFRINDLTVNKYYEICSYCYKAAKFEYADIFSPKQLCDKYLDDRDGGLRKIEPNSIEAFDKWFNLSDAEKWKYNNSSHMWEISFGHTHTMLRLYVEKDNNGYYLMLSGGVYARKEEVVRMFNELKKRNIPVGLYHIESFIDYYKGKDYVGIISAYESGWSYWYGGFPKKGVISFVCIDEEPEEIKKAYQEKVTWYALPNYEVDK